MQLSSLRARLDAAAHVVRDRAPPGGGSVGRRPRAWPCRAGRSSSRPPRASAPNGELLSRTARPSSTASPCSRSYGFGFGQAPIAGTVACLLLLARPRHPALRPARQPRGPAAVGGPGGLGRWSSCSTCRSSRRHRGGARPRRPQRARGRHRRLRPGPGHHRDGAAHGRRPPVSACSCSDWPRSGGCGSPRSSRSRTRSETRAREPRRWRPSPGPGRQHRRPHPRRRRADRARRAPPPRPGCGDGSTASGYDDYFRRF